jgi:hypothetical protein
MDVATPIDDVMKDGYEKYRDAIRSTYKCLGITCTDIGELDAAVDGGVATESTCTCAAYDGCVAPDEGPGRWWTIKEAHNYDGLVKPTRSVCGGDVYKPAGEEEEEEEEGSSESFAGALSVLLVAATM